jgi:DNA sulfur modification protein DndE
VNTEFNLSKIERQRYRPSQDVEDVLEDLRTNLIPYEKFRIARLAIARSMTADETVEALPDGIEMGASIEGQHLFGDDAAVWACLIAESAVGRISNVTEFRRLVEAHWTRGARLLHEDFERADMRIGDMMIFLAKMARKGPGIELGLELPARYGLLRIKVGETSVVYKTGEEITYPLNSPGVSPHAAVLGKTRSGKTRTGIVMAEQIAFGTEFPLLLIDPKGEFVRDGELVQKSEWNGRTLADRLSAIRAIDVPTQAVPLDFLHRAGGAAPPVLSQLASAFKDSFQKTIRSKGDVALDSLRETVLDLVSSPRERIALDDILDAVRIHNLNSGRGKDSIEARLNELCSVPLFEPRIAPGDFFAGRWVIGLGGCTEEARRLVIFLLLDSLARHLLSLKDSDTDAEGNRSLRHLLVIDEAKEILSYRHNALSDLVRKSAAKGGIVLLLSQSPDDFEQEADDFLSQLGAIAVFASSTSTVKNLAPALGRKVQPQEFSDRELPPGVALVKLPNQELTKIIAWQK